MSTVRVFNKSGQDLRAWLTTWGNGSEDWYTIPNGGHEEWSRSDTRGFTLTIDVINKGTTSIRVHAGQDVYVRSDGYAYIRFHLFNP
jgi:hypothetical protein